jgi:hypothetical protein
VVCRAGLVKHVVAHKVELVKLSGYTSEPAEHTFEWAILRLRSKSAQPVQCAAVYYAVVLLNCSICFLQNATVYSLLVFVSTKRLDSRDLFVVCEQTCI